MANKIVENDKVLLYNDLEGIVLRKEIEKLDSYETTYNFEVEDNHNYYVGQETVLVHNKCAEEYLKEALERKMKEAKDDLIDINDKIREHIDNAPGPTR